MLRTGRRAFSWARAGLTGAGRSRAPLRGVQAHSARWRIAKCVCIGAVALPIGLHLASHSLRPALAQTMAAETTPPSGGPAMPEIVARADGLYDANTLRDALKYLLKYEHLDEVEVLWRLARLCYKVGKYQTGNAEESKRLAQQGWGYIERAMALGGEQHNSCQRWAGILLSWSSEFEGIKKKIEKSFEIRDHFVAAIECDGSDATSMHLLGQWCYSVVSVPWYQRQVATVLFATPPHSTYEEALSHFQAAEKADPGFYMVNWLWLGKCHLALGHKQEAKPWLERVVDCSTTLEEEIEAKKEAEALLSKL